MGMKPGKSRAYQRGYHCAAHWPDHKPPLPPNPLLSDLIQAATELRDCVDSQIAMLDPTDKWVEKFGPGVDKLDAALTILGKWLKDKDYGQDPTT